MIKGDLYQNGNGGDRASRPPKFQVTVPKVNLQWDGQHGECSEEAKEDEIPAALLVSDKSKFYGKLFVDIPEDDFALVDPCVTLRWDSQRSVKVYQGEDGEMSVSWQQDEIPRCVISTNGVLELCADSMVMSNCLFSAVGRINDMFGIHDINGSK